jgi:hypothetical protein
MDNLPQATLQELSGHTKLHRPLDGLSDAQHKAWIAEMAKKAAAMPIERPAVRDVGPTQSTNGGVFTPAGSKGFQGLDQATACPGCTPSDMALAVGPTYEVQVVNVAITILNRNGVVQLGYPKSINTFFGLPAGTYTTDPRIVYDWVYGRYVLIMLEESNPFGSNNVGSLLLAVSKTANPTQGWYTYSPAFQIGNTGECPDYPRLGQDTTNGIGEGKGGIYIGINQFGPSPNACFGSYIQNYTLLIPKTPIYSGLGFTYWYEWGLYDPSNGVLLDTLQPANVANKDDRTRAEYLVASQNILFGGGNSSTTPGCSNTSGTVCNGLVVWAVSNPFGFLNGGPSPEFSVARIATSHNYFFPSGANEPGKAHAIETIDTRISGTVAYSAGELYGALETSTLGTAENSPIWFELHPILNDNDNTHCTGSYAGRCSQIVGLEERNEDCFFCGGWRSNGSGFFATLVPDGENNITMVYNFSSDTDYPGTAYASRRVSQVTNTMHDAGFWLSPGLAFYGEGRWGDYTGVAPDFSSGGYDHLWFAGMYSKSDGSWGTVIGRNEFDSPNKF